MEINSHKQIAESFGNINDFSDAIGVSSNVTRKWIYRDRIPAEYWVQVVQAAHQADLPITYRLLAELINHKKAQSITG
jgi:hypothetical protein